LPARSQFIQNRSLFIVGVSRHLNKIAAI